MTSGLQDSHYLEKQYVHQQAICTPASGTFTFHYDAFLHEVSTLGAIQPHIISCREAAPKGKGVHFGPRSAEKHTERFWDGEMHMRWCCNSILAIGWCMPR